MWIGHVVKMPPECLPVEVFLACPTGTSLSGTPRTLCRDYTSHLAWECLWNPQEGLGSNAGEKDVWNTLLSLLPTDGWMDLI